MLHPAGFSPPSSVVEHVRIYHRSIDVAVTQKLLDRSDKVETLRYVVHGEFLLDRKILK
jgi:CRP-like cAMP-binding protein